jgi:hypothetical protein
VPIKPATPKPNCWGGEGGEANPPLVSFIDVPFSIADFNSKTTRMARKFRADKFTR